MDDLRKKMPLSVSLSKSLIFKIDQIVKEKNINSRSAFLSNIIEEVIHDIECVDSLVKCDCAKDWKGRVFYIERYFK